MGARYRTIENGLYGHKTDLIERLRENDVPRWLSPEGPGVYGGSAPDLSPREMNGDEFCRVAREHHDPHHLLFAVDTGGSFGRNTTPENIRDRIKEFHDSATHRRMKEDLRRGEWYDGPHVMVELGERNGVKDVKLVARYKD